MRHKWNQTSPDGLKTCSRCGLEVKAWRVDKGGLGPCIPGRWKVKGNPLQKTLSDPDMTEKIEDGLTICPGCNKKVLNTKFCVSCGYPIHPLKWMPGVVE